MSPVTEQSSSTTGGIKHDQEKLMFDLLPPKALEEIVRVYTYGAKKYERRNWEKGMQWGRVYAAIHRHLTAFWGGEDRDSESGLPHLAHAAFGILALLEYSQTHAELDDRPRKVVSTSMGIIPYIEKMERFKERVKKGGVVECDKHGIPLASLSERPEAKDLFDRMGTQEDYEKRVALRKELQERHRKEWDETFKQMWLNPPSSVE